MGCNDLLLKQVPPFIPTAIVRSGTSRDGRDLCIHLDPVNCWDLPTFKLTANGEALNPGDRDSTACSSIFCVTSIFSSTQ